MKFRFTLNNTTEGQEVLSREPKGWDKTEILTKRDQKYHGIFREFSVKLEFYSGAGKEYIDEIYQTQGIDAEVTLLIEIECNGTYETLYSGKLNLETWESFGNIGSRDSFTSVDIIEIGVTQTVKNRLKTKINLSELETLDGTALTDFTYGPYDLNLHSKEIVYASEFNFTDDATTYFQNVVGWSREGIDNAANVIGDSPGSDVTIQASFSQTLIPDAIITDEVLNYTADTPSLVRSGTYPGTTAQIQSTSLIVASNAGSDTYNITGKIKFGFNLYVNVGATSTSGSKYFNYNVVPRLYMQTGSTVTLLQTEATVSGSANFDSGSSGNNQLIIPFTEYTFDFTQNNMTVADGGVIRLYVKFDTEWVIERPGLGGEYGLAISLQCFVHEDYSASIKSFIKVEQESLTTATTAKAFAIHEAGARIAQSITNQTDAFRSDLFGRKNSQPNTYSSNGCASFGAITNGFQIRKFPIADRPIYMSMEDFYEGLDAIYNLGMGIETGGSGYVIRVEPKEYFYSTNVILRIGNIPDIKVGVAKNYYYNALKIGYEKWETENVNGLEEFNSKRHYSLPVNTDKELTQFSKIVAGGYPLETARRKQYVDETTTDYEYDNLNFIVCLNRTVDGSGNPNTLTTAEKNENYTTTTNILSPATAYNLRISPARNALRWNSVVGAGLIKKPGKSLKLTYTEGNGLMETEFTADTCEGNYNNELLIENQDIQWDGVNTNNLPIWIPEIYEFDYPLSFEDYKNIKTNPTYCLEISRTQSDFIKAYILEIRYKPVSGMASFKLLRANA